MSLFSDRILSGRRGLFCLHENQRLHAEGEQKVSSTFWKRWWVSKGQSPLTHSAECGSLIVRRSLGELENLFAREKVLENQLLVESNLKNYPVDDF